MSLYVKRDVFEEIDGVRRLIACAGQEVPRRYAHLISPDDIGVPASATPVAIIAERRRSTANARSRRAPGAIDYSTLRQADLKAELDRRGIPYPQGRVRNAELIELLEQSDAAA